MVDFTEEQDLEVMKFVEEKILETKQQEQWCIAADQFFREALYNVAMKVEQQIYDAYVLEVGKGFYQAFRQANFEQSPNPVENE